MRVVYNIYRYCLKLETRSQIFRALRKKKTKKEMTEGISLSPFRVAWSHAGARHCEVHLTLSQSITLVCYNLATRLRRSEVDSALVKHLQVFLCDDFERGV